MAAPTTDTGRHFDSLEQEVFLNLWRTYDRLRALEEELNGVEAAARKYARPKVYVAVGKKKEAVV